MVMSSEIAAYVAISTVFFLLICNKILESKIFHVTSHEHWYSWLLHIALLKQKSQFWNP